jgi:uncharacterized protein YciI
VDDHGRETMTLYAVVREAGDKWTDGKGAFDQPGVNDHAAFMNNLADLGFVLFAGPLAGTEFDRLRALVIIDAASESDIRQRLAADPWEQDHHLRTATLEQWNLLVGARRLAMPAE